MINSNNYVVGWSWHRAGNVTEVGQLTLTMANWRYCTVTQSFLASIFRCVDPLSKIGKKVVYLHVSEIILDKNTTNCCLLRFDNHNGIFSCKNFSLRRTFFIKFWAANDFFQGIMDSDFRAWDISIIEQIFIVVFNVVFRPWWRVEGLEGFDPGKLKSKH